MKLSEFIKIGFEGNISAFAKSLGVGPNQVQRWLKRDCRMINNEIYCKITKQTKKESK